MSIVIDTMVSVIIPAYNRSAMLREAVESALNQTYRPIEVIISNDGSTDDTRQVADELGSTHSGVVFVVHNENRGAGPAREAGRLRARGEFIQYLDSDDLLLPRKFEWQVAALRDQPACGASYGFIRLVDEQGRVRPGPYKGSGDGLESLFPRLLYDRWWNTDCALFRRTVCDAVGPWSDLRFSQDWEYDARVGALKVPLAAVEEYVCVQRQHEGLRLTGHGRWLNGPDQVRFFGKLYECALAAGVSPESPEMQHFVRWVFFAARQLASGGDDGAARQLLPLAEQAARQRLQLVLYRHISRLLGWQRTARLSARLKQWTARRYGDQTLRQSWMPERR